MHPENPRGRLTVKTDAEIESLLCTSGLRGGRTPRRLPGLGSEGVSPAHDGSHPRRPNASAGFIPTTHSGSTTTSVFTELAMKQAWCA